MTNIKRLVEDLALHYRTKFLVINFNEKSVQILCKKKNEKGKVLLLFFTFQ